MDIMMSQSNSKGNMLWKRYRRLHFEQVTARLENCFVYKDVSIKSRKATKDKLYENTTFIY